jgi:hypothetical protein
MRNVNIKTSSRRGVLFFVLTVACGLQLGNEMTATDKEK